MFQFSYKIISKKMFSAGSGLISVMEAHLVVAMLHIRLIAQRYSDGVDRGI
jgi:hypothetical protein